MLSTQLILVLSTWLSLQWIECTRQCSQWNVLSEIARVKGSQHPSLLLESAWRVGDWGTMKEVLAQADRVMPDNVSHVVSLYRGYLALQQEEVRF